MERRNRLRLLQPWLEAMVSTGNTETATHNAVGKIYVTLNKDPVTFLTNNQFYDPKVSSTASRLQLQYMHGARVAHYAVAILSRVMSLVV